MDRDVLFAIDCFALAAGCFSAFYAFRAVRATIASAYRERFGLRSLSGAAISVLMQGGSTVLKYYLNIG